MGTKLNNLLSEKRSAIVKQWFDAIAETYPPDTANFLRDQKNQFANPVGSTVAQSIEGIFDELLNGMNAQKTTEYLDNIVRIRAVQDFTPALAVSFVFFLKRIIREELAGEIKDGMVSEELLVFESRIDEIALSAFDIFMKCRERLYEIKANEIRNMTFRLLQRANLISDAGWSGADCKENNSA